MNNNWRCEEESEVEMKGGLHESCWMAISVWHLRQAAILVSLWRGKGGPESDRGDWERVSRGCEACDVAYPFSSRHLDTIMLCCSEELVDHAVIVADSFGCFCARPRSRLSLPGFRVAVSSDADTECRFVSGRDAFFG